ncbi:MAG TPA: hypothetical protein VMV53_10380 [Acidimicrobiales bacterium]|nr:hypothetical protein [Acidimicrobiales bacterium]
MRVAVATCAGEHVDRDQPLLIEALANVGVAAEARVWDDPAARWDDVELVVVRSTWGYAQRHDEFLGWARSLARVENRVEVLEYFSDKHYLGDLAARGHRVVATRYCDVDEVPEFFAGDFVVKPCVGAGSIDAERYGPDEHERARAHVARLHATGRDVLIQPYVASVDERGERALVFIDGVFSHAMTKGALLNTASHERDWLFRAEQMSRAEPEPEALALAEAILAEADLADLLYARVDLVHDETGWAVMELELVEPSLFLGYHDAAPGALARAIAARLD